MEAGIDEKKVGGKRDVQRVAIAEKKRRLDDVANQLQQNPRRRNNVGSVAVQLQTRSMQNNLGLFKLRNLGRMFPATVEMP